VSTQKPSTNCITLFARTQTWKATTLNLEVQEEEEVEVVEAVAVVAITVGADFIFLSLPTAKEAKWTMSFHFSIVFSPLLHKIVGPPTLVGTRYTVGVLLHLTLPSSVFWTLLPQ
jgi:hypothetical protein